jgi:tetratricopeptide (TPR) repeat protein
VGSASHAKFLSFLALYLQRARRDGATTMGLFSRKLSYEEAVALYDEALAALAEGDHQKADRLGKKLLDVRFTGGFEIRARAVAAQGDLKEAIEIAREGVAKAPIVAQLWLTLGILLSDSCDYAGAVEAFDRGLACPNAPAHVLFVNRAISLLRDKKDQEGLDSARRALELAPEEDVHFQAQARMVEAEALVYLEHYDDASRICSETLKQIEFVDDTEQTKAFLLAIRGLATWRGKRETEGALENFREAVRLQNYNSIALSLRREIRSETSDQTKLWLVVVGGRRYVLLSKEDADNEPQELGFFATYRVASENQEEALDYIRDLESGYEISGWKIEEFKQLGFAPGVLKGVVWRNPGFMFYPLEAE